MAFLNHSLLQRALLLLIVILPYAAKAQDTLCINSACFSITYADTIAEKQKGLMFKTYLPPNDGMLFRWKSEHYITMWMKNTYIPLDILWLNKDFEIVDFKQSAIPLNTRKLKSDKKAMYILEINGGLIKKFNIQKGQSFYLKTTH